MTKTIGSSRRREWLLASISACAMALALTLLAGAHRAKAEQAHGIAMHGAPRQPASFRHFAYVNPDAPKGGRLRLGVLGSYDSLNPLIVKGNSAAGVRDYVYESLMVRALDEPFTLYGLVAESIDAPPDRSHVSFRINPRARFSDGTPVTADDVIFSHALLRDHGRPNLRTYYKKVMRSERVSDREVRFVFADGNDRELPLILGLMPVLPRHKLTIESFERTTLEPVTGSGPYVIERVEPGRAIVFRRNTDYWGRDLPVNRGRYNFDQVRFEYFRDASAMFEAFKVGDIDMRVEEEPGRWAEGYNFPAASDGRVLQREFPIALPAGMSAFAFNTRRPPFDNRNVRQALILLFDFEWINRSLYHGLYKRTQSFFERSALSSHGKPADDYERRLLTPFSSEVTAAVLEGRHRLPTSKGSGRNRENAVAAFKLLNQAGYSLDDGHLVDKDRKPLDFEILAATRAQERLALSFAASLKPIGITARVRQVDSAQYQSRLKSYDFDMIQSNWPASLSPGNEQLFRWSSSAAAVEGTFNYVGVNSRAVDAMIEAMLAATEEGQFVSSVRALDRVLLSGDYVIPLFHLPHQWVAHWRHLSQPATTSLFGFALDTWWIDGAR